VDTSTQKFKAAIQLLMGILQAILLVMVMFMFVDRIKLMDVTFTSKIINDFLSFDKVYDNLSLYI
jgi:hypothetical protein